MNAKRPQEPLADERPLLASPSVGRPVDDAGDEISDGESEKDGECFAPTEKMYAKEIQKQQTARRDDGNRLDGAEGR